jgi:hypothetical protein
MDASRLAGACGCMGNRGRKKLLGKAGKLIHTQPWLPRSGRHAEWLPQNRFELSPGTGRKTRRPPGRIFRPCRGFLSRSRLCYWLFPRSIPRLRSFKTLPRPPKRLQIQARPRKTPNFRWVTSVPISLSIWPWMLYWYALRIARSRSKPAFDGVKRDFGYAPIA